MAHEKHAGQRRKKSEIPYFLHLADVTSRVSHYGFNAYGPLKRDLRFIDCVLASSYGHDLYEDTDADYDGVRLCVGEKIADLILECTREGDDKTITRQEKWDFLMTFKKKSPTSVVIKIADRFVNVHNYWDTDPRYAALYALQGTPLYTFFAKNSLVWPKEIAESVQQDIETLGDIIKTRYDMNVFKSLKDIEKEVT